VPGLTAPPPAEVESFLDTDSAPAPEETPARYRTMLLTSVTFLFNLAN